MRSRVSAALAGAFASLIVSVVAFAGGPATATQGQPVIAGTTNTENEATVLCQGNIGEPCPTAADRAVYGITASGITLHGEAKAGTGVLGRGTENGVQAQGGTFGVFATGNDYGVYASAPNHGIYAEATASGGLGVQAVATTSAATALQVTGKAKFSRSGLVTIAAGTSSKTVTLAGVTTASMVLATSQTNAAVYVKSATPASGSFTIRLTGNAPTGGVKVAYFVLN